MVAMHGTKTTSGRWFWQHGCEFGGVGLLRRECKMSSNSGLQAVNSLQSVLR
jgi:hypothetical protein